MKQLMILDRKTMRKRRTRIFIDHIKHKIKQWRIKQQAKKIVEKIRKEYIRTGDAEITLKSKKDISNALDYLREQQLIDYEHSTGIANHRYYIYISEAVQNDKTKNNELQARQ